MLRRVVVSSCQNVSVVVDPELTPNVLKHRRIAIVNNGSVLSNKDEDAVKKKFVYMVDDSSSSVVSVRPRSRLTFAPRKWDPPGIMDIDQLT